jgi:hypothetical protein
MPPKKMEFRLPQAMLDEAAANLVSPYGVAPNPTDAFGSTEHSPASLAQQDSIARMPEEDRCAELATALIREHLAVHDAPAATRDAFNVAFPWKVNSATKRSAIATALQLQAGTGTDGKSLLEQLVYRAVQGAVPQSLGSTGQRFDFTQDGVDINGHTVGSTSDHFSIKSLHELDIDHATVLGKGAGGRVLKAMLMSTGEYYAVKEIGIGSVEAMKQVKAEISVLWESHRGSDDVPCPYLISCHGVFYEQGLLYIVMDLMDGSLKDAMDVHGPFAEEPLRGMMYQALLGLEFMHYQKKQLHRDVKPHNILYSSVGAVKISDFGIASDRVQTVHQNAQGTFCGTLLYMTPGRVEGKQYSFDADIWGLGMSIYQLALGHLPPSSGSAFAVHAMRDSPPRFPDDVPGFSQAFRDFVAVCLTPETTALVRDLLQHPWMRGMTIERSTQLVRSAAAEVNEARARRSVALTQQASAAAAAATQVNALAYLDAAIGPDF